MADDSRLGDALLGPVGTRAAPGSRWIAWGGAYVVLAAFPVLAGLGRLGYCLRHGWVGNLPFYRQCYSDLAGAVPLAGIGKGLAAYLTGAVPLDQPVLTGMVMSGLGGLASAITGDPIGLPTQRVFILFWAMLAMVGLAVMGWLVARMPGHPGARPLAVLLSPVAALTVLLAPDVLGVTLCTLGIWLWLTRRPVLAGFTLGAAIMSISYPLIVVFVAVLCSLRGGEAPEPVARQRERVRLGAGLAVGVLMCILPALSAPGVLTQAWATWFTASTGLGSLWHIPAMAGLAVPAEAATTLAVVGWAVAGVLAAVLVLGQQTPPPLGAVLLVAVAVVLVTGKSFAVQSSLWLVPLVALAGLRWRDILWWWAAEVAHFVAVWLYVGGVQGDPNRGLPAGWYAVFVLLRVAAVAWLAWSAWSTRPDAAPAPQAPRFRDPPENVAKPREPSGVYPGFRGVTDPQPGPESQ